MGARTLSTLNITAFITSTLTGCLLNYNNGKPFVEFLIPIMESISAGTVIAMLINLLIDKNNSRDQFDSQFAQIMQKLCMLLSYNEINYIYLRMLSIELTELRKKHAPTPYSDSVATAVVRYLDNPMSKSARDELYTIVSGNKLPVDIR